MTMTIGDIASTFRARSGAGKANKASPFITEGLTPAPLPRLDDDHVVVLPPEQILSLQVNALHVNESVLGYQRLPTSRALRRVDEMTKALGRGVPLPDVQVTTDGEVVDGVKRAIAHLALRRDMRVAPRDLSPAQRREIFANQGMSEKLTRDHAIWVANNPIAEYVRWAFLDPDSPWEGMVSQTSTKGKLSPAGLERLVGMYGTGAMLNSNEIQNRASVWDRFSVSRANQLARLLRAFGSAKTNPKAFHHTNLRAITSAAIVIILRDERPGNIDRWDSHMPRFDFADRRYDLSPKSAERVELLLRHWNKRLSPERQVSYDYKTREAA